MDTKRSTNGRENSREKAQKAQKGRTADDADSGTEWT
jgi:hypothetical protein